jgi:serine phosphatase RsbU (regulator of sigma subunit)/anti-sigma regulatory factor (Ser/Thr protein kinase)
VRLRSRLLLAGLAVLVAAAAVAVFIVRLGGEALQDQAFAQLRSVREAKANQIEMAIGDFLDNLDLLAESDVAIEGLQALGPAFDELGEPTDPAALDAYYANEFIPRVIGRELTGADPRATEPSTAAGRRLQELYLVENPFPVGSKDYMFDADDGSDYSAVHARIHPFFRAAVESFAAYDIFLIGNEGTVLYTVFKEVDLGTNLVTGPLNESGLAAAWLGVNSRGGAVLAVTDFDPYLPSYNAPAAFAAEPVFDDIGTRVGTIAMQLPVDRINAVMTSQQRWSEVGLGESGETYLVADDLKMRNDSRFLIEDPDDYFAAISAIEDPATVEAIRAFGSTIGLQTVDTEGTRDALGGNTAERIFEDYRGVRVLSSYRPLNLGRSRLEWAIMSEIDEAEAFAAETDLFRTAMVALAATGVALGALIIFGAARLTRPLRVLEDETGHVEDFDFMSADSYDTTTIDRVARRRDEIGDLAGAFGRMTVSLGENIRSRAEVEAELGVAAQIQESMLPLTFPSFPTHVEFEIHARLTPAKEIGGDFFEHGFVDADKFFFAVGDVSGKGVPAALFMASIKTLIRSAALRGESPAALLTQINAELSRDNPEMMFATIWLGVLDLREGVITYTNAGHNPPVKVCADGAEWVADVHGPMVGPIPGIAYDQGELRVDPNDTIVVYSDGVTEAMNPAGDFFGEDRLAEVVRGENVAGSEDLTGKVVDAVLGWESGGERSDDVTVMALRYHATRLGETYDAVLPVGADSSGEITSINEAMADFARGHDISEGLVQRTQIALDEVLANVASHSGATAAAVRVWIDRGRVIVEVSDDGAPHNPLTAPAPDIDVPLEDRQIGGLGVHLVRSLALEATYDYRGHRNVLTMSFGEEQG